MTIASTPRTAIVVRREVWHVDIARTAASLEAIEAALPRLAAAEQAWPRDGQSPVRRVTRIALRLLLERFLSPDDALRLRGAPFPLEQHGRPTLPSDLPPMAFSLAHSGSDALIAVATRGPIGVDLECPRRVRMSAERRAAMIEAACALGCDRAIPATATAHDRATDPDQDRALLVAWTRIEAIGKARGTGAAAVLADLGIVARGGGGRTADDDSPQPNHGGAGRHHRRRPIDDLVAHDLAMAGGIVAAIALPPGELPPPLTTLPATVARLNTLATPITAPPLSEAY